jgi:hypothetical protein
LKVEKMPQIELTDEAIAALERIARLRNLDGPGEALAEAIQVETQVAEAAEDGAQLVVAKDGKTLYQLVLPKGS